jgi:hypothetical protein
MADDDWLDLRDPRSADVSIPITTTATTDINKAFDDIAALFEVYPQPPEKSSKQTKQETRGKTLHLNTRKTKSK